MSGSSLQRRVALLEQDSPSDDLQAELAAARKYYADPLGFVRWAYPVVWMPRCLLFALAQATQHQLRKIPTFWGEVSHFLHLHASASAYSSGMDYAESAKDSLEDQWRAKLEAAEVRYSDAPSSETKATYLDLLKTFADLVLRGDAPEEA